MVQFKSILVATATFVSIVSAVPTLETGNSLNIRQLPHPDVLASFINDVLDGVERLPEIKAPIKLGGSSCREIIQKCHDRIAKIPGLIS